jgi:hypothetical protein
MRRIGLLMGWTDADLEARSWLAAFLQGFAGARLVGRHRLNADATRAPALAKELIELAI